MLTLPSSNTVSLSVPYEGHYEKQTKRQWSRKKLLFSNFSPINLYDSLVNQLKIEHFLARLCSIVIIVQPLSTQRLQSCIVRCETHFARGLNFQVDVAYCAQPHTKEFANNVRANVRHKTIS